MKKGLKFQPKYIGIYVMVGAVVTAMGTAVVVGLTALGKSMGLGGVGAFFSGLFTVLGIVIVLCILGYLVAALFGGADEL